MKVGHEDSNSYKGVIPESWCCVDCGKDTAPGCFNRVKMEKAFEKLRAKALLEGRDDVKDESVKQTYDNDTELFMVRASVWAKAGMEPWGRMSVH